MRDKRKEYILGTAIEMTAIISVDTATSAKVTILDPGFIVMVNEGNMTKSADKVYTYVYQTTSTDVCGCYTARFSIASGGYTTVWEEEFFLKRQAGT